MTGVIDRLWGTMRARGTSSSLLMLFRLLRTRFSQLACVREHKHSGTFGCKYNQCKAEEKQQLWKSRESDQWQRQVWWRSQPTDWPELCACRPTALWDAREEPADGSGATDWDQQAEEERVLSYNGRQEGVRKDAEAFRMKREPSHSSRWVRSNSRLVSSTRLSILYD